MNAKQFVEMVAGMEQGRASRLDELIQSARDIQAVEAAKGEAGKRAKDYERAVTAIAALDRAITNPAALEIRSYTGYPIVTGNEVFVRACVEERERLTAALPNPEALKLIYRRNEVRR